jgi:hypothetical protein
MLATLFHDRGDPAPPHNTGGLGSLIDTFVQGVAHALGWRAGSAIAQALGPAALIVLALAGVAVYLLRRHRARH